MDEILTAVDSLPTVISGLTFPDNNKIISGYITTSTNDIINYLTSLESVFRNAATEITNGAVESVKLEIDSQSSEIKKEIDSQSQGIKTEIDSQSSEIKKEIDSQSNEIKKEIYNRSKEINEKLSCIFQEEQVIQCKIKELAHKTRKCYKRDH